MERRAGWWPFAGLCVMVLSMTIPPSRSIAPDLSLVFATLAAVGLFIEVWKLQDPRLNN